MKLSVVCWKWGGHTMGHHRANYNAKHVNTLASMVSRHLKMPHEIVCVTDNPEGIDGGVRIVPLWNDLHDLGRCFVRLKAFSAEIGDLLGERFVSLDLDTVITGPLDPLFDRPEPFVVWADPSRKTPYCGSQWMLTAGALPQVWSEFSHAEHATLKQKFGYFGSDQAWMAHKIKDAPRWTKADGVFSFRMHLMQLRGGDPFGLKFRRRVKYMGAATLPPNARIVHFHGAHDPSQAMVQTQLPWVVENWR